MNEEVKPNGKIILSPLTPSYTHPIRSMRSNNFGQATKQLSKQSFKYDTPKKKPPEEQNEIERKKRVITVDVITSTFTHCQTKNAAQKLKSIAENENNEMKKMIETIVRLYVSMIIICFICCCAFGVLKLSFLFIIFFLFCLVWFRRFYSRTSTHWNFSCFHFGIQ